MNIKSKRVYSEYCQDAVKLLGHLIHVARKERKMTASELAERAGISRGTLHKIEQGSPTCELGITFEVAALVGVKLFGMGRDMLSSEAEHMEKRLTLLPHRVRKKQGFVDDDF